MQYRRLGRSGVRVSAVSLGGWLTHGRTLEDNETTSIVRRAFELGINFFDSADVYNLGEAEKALGLAVKGMRREDLFLATKCFFPFTDAPNDRGLNRKHIVESVENSLRRLGTDYIDLFQFHRFDPDTPVEETVRAVDDCVRQGKIIYWGTSCWSAAQITDMVHTAFDWRCTLPVSNQPPYNMFQRDIERDVISTCEQKGLSQVVFSPLAQGVLTGKYKPGHQFPEGSRAADEKSNQFMGRYMTDEALTKVAAIGEIAKEFGLTTGQFALAWCLRQPNVASVIVGATKTSQIEENAAAADAVVSDEAWGRVEQILSGDDHDE
ncbi:MAG: aldo/keto reductase family protein [Fimbriimonadaceae bacterium]|nr:aldo/keto reductase family protein [Fimbriimonadaceae bacterium]